MASQTNAVIFVSVRFSVLAPCVVTWWCCCVQKLYLCLTGLFSPTSAMSYTQESVKRVFVCSQFAQYDVESCVVFQLYSPVKQRDARAYLFARGNIILE